MRFPGRGIRGRAGGYAPSGTGMYSQRGRVCAKRVGDVGPVGRGGGLQTAQSDGLTNDEAKDVDMWFENVCCGLFGPCGGNHNVCGFAVNCVQTNR